MTTLRTLRLQLNTFVSGPQAWMFLAQQRGYLAEAGLALAFEPGDTAANTVPRMAADARLDLGFGDLNALIEHVGRGRPGAPVAIFAPYNASPYTIAVPAGSPVRGPRDLAGCHLVAHPADAAWLLFDEFCTSTGLDGATVRTSFAPEPHSELVPRLLAGESLLLIAHNQSLRALLQTIEGSAEPRLPGSNLGNGAPRRYRLDREGKIVAIERFGDETGPEESGG